ncbi:hypothetical protein [Hydrogenimonas sp.]
MFKIAKWHNNYQAPSVLMIDDLSDAYINVYNEPFRNDWGHLCNKENSAFSFLQKYLLNQYPHIKITFFSPYDRHNVINQNSSFSSKKFALGEREEYIFFLKYLVSSGHEIAHHGSNHGCFINQHNPSTINNWIHEWELFKNIQQGVETTKKGINLFKKFCDIDIAGGKYCGYKTNRFSDAIIDVCNFLYWCRESNITQHCHSEQYFGKNNIIAFPTNFAGNSFIRLSYMTGKKERDKKKKFLKYFQPLYNLYSYLKLYNLYRKKQIISIQEHISPSTSAGTVQSANIITDIKSLNKIYHTLSYLSIWYATCEEIAKYIYTRDHSSITIIDKLLIINFNNHKNLKNTSITLLNDHLFKINDGENTYVSTLNNGAYVVNLPIRTGKNKYYLIR